MKEEPVTYAVLREFLLGNIDDEARDRIESLVLTDPQTRDRVLAIEEDLIEDYLEDSLSLEDKERFVSLYAQTEEQRRKLRITKSIKEWALRDTGKTQAAPVPVSVWRRLRTRLQLKPVFVIPIAVTIVIAIVLAFVWLNSQLNQRKHRAAEQELARLNSPASLRETPPYMTSFELRPVTVRSVDSEPEINLGGETRTVEMHLPWIRKERYAAFEAEVSRIGDNESFSIRNVQAENDGGYRIRLRLPAQTLQRGHYRIQLTGISSDGSRSSPEEYQFAVSR